MEQFTDKQLRSFANGSLLGDPETSKKIFDEIEKNPEGEIARKIAEYEYRISQHVERLDLPAIAKAANEFENGIRPRNATKNADGTLRDHE